jgi:hypothetical protein
VGQVGKSDDTLTHGVLRSESKSLEVSFVQVKEAQKKKENNKKEDIRYCIRAFLACKKKAFLAVSLNFIY